MFRIEAQGSSEIDLRSRQRNAVLDARLLLVNLSKNLPHCCRRFSMGAESGSSLFRRGRPKVIEAQAMSCYACQQTPVRRRPEFPLILCWRVLLRINRSPRRSPERIEIRTVPGGKAANMSSAQKNRCMSPLGLQTNAGTLV